MTKERLCDSFYAAVYWGPRKQPVEACAALATAFLGRIARIDPAFSRWFDTAYSRKKALERPVAPSEAALKKLLLSGRNRNDADRKIIEDLGFLLVFWNGGEDRDATGLTIKCGRHAQGMGNSCIVGFSESGPNTDRLLQAPLLIELFLCMLEAWEAEEGVVASSGYHNLRPGSVKRDPRIGWLTYVPRSLGRVPPLPPPSTSRPVGEKGTLIVLTPERFSVNNPAHVEIADRVTDLLEEAGLRKPSVP